MLSSLCLRHVSLNTETETDYSLTAREVFYAVQKNYVDAGLESTEPLLGL
jgi:hypothetical protein